ncbi:MAG: 1-acyl-sn-glycerol-3-phosphate acyltransferase [Thioalkalivibrio sp.]|nr:MAG: 1-acyl-sn-glycerol-3-phosphate acyltransferase [Thioalkalivibrio sp.]
MWGTLRASYRLLRVFLHLGEGIWISARYGSPRGSGDELCRRRRAFYRRALELSGIELEITGEPIPGSALVVGNHVSWLDIPVLGTCLDVRFLSKAEVARWPLIGWLARRNGTLFIRRGAHESEALIRTIGTALRQGDQVAVFPEATTTDGSDVRHFHARLFAAAVDTLSPVQPVAFDYGREPDGSPPAAAFTAGIGVLRHAWRLLMRERTFVRLHILHPLPVGPGTTRRELASRSRAVIRAEVVLPLRHEVASTEKKGPD